MGVCHGNKNGKGGFKLSLRGEDSAFDFAVLTRDVGAARTWLRSKARGSERFGLLANGVPAVVVRKHTEGVGQDGRPSIVGQILAGEVQLILNTPHGTTSGGSPRLDGYEIRTAAILTNIPCITTLTAATACVEGIRTLKEGVSTFAALQEQHAS